MLNIKTNTDKKDFILSTLIILNKGVDELMTGKEVKEAAVSIGKIINYSGEVDSVAERYLLKFNTKMNIGKSLI